MGRDLYLDGEDFDEYHHTWTRRNDQISDLPTFFGFKFILIHLLKLIIALLFSTNLMTIDQLHTFCDQQIDQELIDYNLETDYQRRNSQIIETIHLLSVIMNEKYTDQSNYSDQIELSYV